LRQAARVLRAWQLTLLVATSAATLHAEPGEDAVRLQYTAPDECPDAASFAREVRARTARGRFAEPGELARTFDVRLTADAHGFSGNVEFLDDGGARVGRHVHGEQCDAVVSTLALITALALDASPPGAASKPDTSAPKPAEASPRAPTVTPARAVQTQASPSRVTRHSLRGARFGVLSGYGSALGAPELALLGQLDFSTSALRLSAHYAWHERAVDAGRSANLRLVGLESSVCPWRFRRDTLGVTPCAALDVGWLRAAGVASKQLSSTRGEGIAWAALGAQLGLSWEPEGPFWVELRAEAEFPLRAGYRFTFESPHQTAYEVPYLAGSVALAGGVRFW
jgi:hypothetical protein